MQWHALRIIHSVDDGADIPKGCIKRQSWICRLRCWHWIGFAAIHEHKKCSDSDGNDGNDGNYYWISFAHTVNRLEVLSGRPARPDACSLAGMIGTPLNRTKRNQRC